MGRLGGVIKSSGWMGWALSELAACAPLSWKWMSKGVLWTGRQIWLAGKSGMHADEDFLRPHLPHALKGLHTLKQAACQA